MSKLGVTISLTEKSPEELEAYLERMRQLGVSSVFASLQIPGDNAQILQKTLSKVGPYIKSRQMEFVADVSPRTFKNFTLTDMKEYGITSLRIDNGMTEKEIAEISKDFRIILNASTINDEFLDALKMNGFCGEFEAWHNYYPRKNTGLDLAFFEERNQWMKSRNVKTAAFIAGDKEMRGTIYEGLPTLERHRSISPFLAFLEMKEKYRINKIILGDFDLTEAVYLKFKTFQECGSIGLRIENVKEPAILGKVFHNRVDIAEDVIRADEFRRSSKKQFSPGNCAERGKGSITIDNKLYGRYMGELQIVLRSLPADEKVNVVGNVAEEDIALLAYVKQLKYPFVLAQPE